MYIKGQDIIYKKNNKKGKIIEIHYNDITPYYTILLSDENKEIQTVKTNLQKIKKNKTRRKLYFKKKSLKKSS